jgi:hypothetical protein
MLRSILFSVVALAAAGTALAHDGERWDRGGHARQEWRQPRGEWRHARYEGYREHRPVVRYYAPEYDAAPVYYGPHYYRYPQAYAYGQVIAPALGLGLVIPLR